VSKHFAAVAVCLSLAACGGDGPLAGVAPPRLHAGRASGLGEPRFKRLDAVFVAGVAYDPLRHPGNMSASDVRAKARAAAGPLRAACSALDPADTLTGPYGRACLARLDAGAAHLPTCPPPPLPKVPPGYNVFSGGGFCPPAAALSHALLSREYRLSRLADRAADAAPIAAACKSALRRPEAANVLDRDFISLYALVSHGTIAGTPREVAAEQRIFDIAGRVQAALPTYKLQLERFRAGCA
jgi:hypothetical protein